MEIGRAFLSLQKNNKKKKKEGEFKAPFSFHIVLNSTASNVVNRSKN